MGWVGNVDHLKASERGRPTKPQSMSVNDINMQGKGNSAATPEGKSILD